LDSRVDLVIQAFKDAIHNVNVFGAFLVILGFLVVALILIFWEKVEEYISYRYLKRLFFKNGEAIGLTKDELEILWKYSNKLHKSPFLAIEYKAPFEKVIQAYIEENPDTYSEELIKSMRKKLGFDKLPSFIPLVSTKDIDIFQVGNLIYQQKSYPIALYDKDERFMYWYLIDWKPPFPFKKGDTVKIRFVRDNDAIYIVEGRIEDIYEDKGKYIIKIPHTFNLIQIQRRRNFRLRIHLPITVVIGEGDKQVKVETETADISIDGVGFCLPILKARELNINVGGEIGVSIQFEERTVSAKGVVKNIREVDKRVCYGVEFTQIDREDKNFLLRFVQEKQQEILKAYKRLKTFD